MSTADPGEERCDPSPRFFTVGDHTASSSDPRHAALGRRGTPLSSWLWSKRWQSPDGYMPDQLSRSRGSEMRNDLVPFPTDGHDFGAPQAQRSELDLKAMDLNIDAPTTAENLEAPAALS